MKPIADPDNTNVIEDCQTISKTIIGKIQDLKEHHRISTASLLRLKAYSEVMVEGFQEQKDRIVVHQSRKKSWLTAGLGLKILGTLIALVFEWILDLPVPTMVTCISVIGIAIKLDAWYKNRRTNKSVMKHINGYFELEEWKEMKNHENILDSRIRLAMEIFKELGRESIYNAEFEIEEKHLAELPETVIRPPRLIRAMRLVKKVAGLENKFNSVLDYCSDFGMESIEAVEQTYDIASAGLGEIIPISLFQVTIRFITIVLSLYEVFRLHGAVTFENETTKRIQKHVDCQMQKLCVYHETLSSIELKYTSELCTFTN